MNASSSTQISSSLTPSSLGQAYNSVSNVCTNETPVQGTSSTTGSATNAKISIAYSFDELCRKLKVQTSIGALFGNVVDNFSEKLTFLSQIRKYSYGLYIVVSGTYEISTATLMNPSLNPIEINDWDKFVQSYGDGYVNSITMGSEFYAVLTVSAYSETELTALESNMQAAGIIDGAAISTQMQNNINNFYSSFIQHISFNCLIRGSSDAQQPTIANILTYATNFSMAIPVNPVTITFTVTGYENIPTFPIDNVLNNVTFENVVANRNLLTGGTERINAGAAGAWGRVSTLCNLIGEIAAIYNFYGGEPNDNSNYFQNAQTSAQSDMQTLTELFNSYVASPTTLLAWEGAPSLHLGIPTIQFQVSSSEIAGGNGGGAFNDFQYLAQLAGSRELVLRNKMYISSVSVSFGNYVGALSIQYTSARTNPTINVPLLTHGAGGGTVQSLDNLTNPGNQQGNVIAYFSGSSGAVIDNLVISTETGQQAGGGGSGGQAFNVKAQPGLIAFSGGNGTYLNNLSQEYVTFYPVIFMPTTSI